jgi:hypothetical protein
MMRGHVCQQATLLDSGQVLISGGVGSNRNEINSAEIFNPATGTFSAISPYADAPTGTNGCEAAISTLLAVGNVLLVWEDSGAELFDPSIRSFRPTGGTFKEIYADGMPTSTLLLNGKVLVAGGADLNSGIRSSAYVYDSSAGTFTRTGSMAAGRADDSTATLLPDGTVLVAGPDFNVPVGPAVNDGYQFGTWDYSGELYDPVSGTFTDVGSPFDARGGHTATLLNDGRVLLAGGSASEQGPFAVLASAELYNPRVAMPAPALLTVSGGAAILHASTQRLVSSGNPAAAGEVLEIFGTGLFNGGVIPPWVAIGGQMAEVLFFGDAPGFPGLNQINVRVPSGLAPGPAVSVRMNYLSRPSNEVTLWVQ